MDGAVVINLGEGFVPFVTSQRLDFEEAPTLASTSVVTSAEKWTFGISGEFADTLLL